MLTSYYYPYERSPAWKEAEGIPVPIVAPIVNPEQYYPEDTVRLQYPADLPEEPCPVDQDNAASWTEIQREKAEKAPHAHTIQELKDFVGSIIFSIYCYKLTRKQIESIGCELRKSNPGKKDRYIRFDPKILDEYALPFINALSQLTYILQENVETGRQERQTSGSPNHPPHINTLRILGAFFPEDQGSLQRGTVQYTIGSTWLRLSSHPLPLVQSLCGEGNASFSPLRLLTLN